MCVWKGNGFIFERGAGLQKEGKRKRDVGYMCIHMEGDLYMEIVNTSMNTDHGYTRVMGVQICTRGGSLKEMDRLIYR